MADPVELEPQEQDEAEERSAVTARVIHRAVTKQGEEELERPTSALAWSGLAAGLSMSLSFLAEAMLRAHLPDTEWRPLISKLGYPAGFLFVVLGRQQLFTENTLTAILPVLNRSKSASLSNVARLWAVVFAANIVGAFIAAWFFGNTPVLEGKVKHAMWEISGEATRIDFYTALLRGIPAGWLIALVVWLRAAVNVAEFAAIFVPTYLVGLGSFTHIIAGSVEALFLVLTGEMSLAAYAGGYMIPTLIGNTIGGVVLVAALNHAQVVSNR